MTHFVLCLILLFQAKPVSAQTADERAIRANYAQWQQAYKQKRPQLIEHLLPSRFRFMDIEGIESSRDEFINEWLREGIKAKDGYKQKIVIYKIRTNSRQIRVVVDDGDRRHRDYWQKSNGIWKLSKRNMYEPSATHDRNSGYIQRKK